MRSSLRAFGIGLFIAGASFTLYNQFEPSQETKETKQYEQQVKEYEKKIAELEKQLSQLPEDKEVPSSNTNSQPPATEEDEENKDTSTVPTGEATSENNNEDIVTATIYIYENVSLYSIGQQVEDEGILSNGRELELFLSKPEYARSIQKGAFDLRSDMTIEQIAKTLTGKKVD